MSLLGLLQHDESKEKKASGKPNAFFLMHRVFIF